MDTTTKIPTTARGKASLKAFMIWLLAKIILLTVRVIVVHRDRLDSVKSSGLPVLYAFWHGRQLGLFKFNPEEKLCVLASRSQDGEIQSRVCRLFGIRVERGSSSRGGLSGLLALQRQLKTGCSIAMAIDGPRGPAFVAKPGIVVLARASGLPIVPVTVGVQPRWVLSRSWDQFLIPRPFSRAFVAFGTPIHVSRACSSSEIQSITNALSIGLRSLTEEVDSLCLPR